VSTVTVTGPDGPAYLVDFRRMVVLGKYATHASAMAAAERYGDHTDVLLDDLRDLYTGYTSAARDDLLASISDAHPPSRGTTPEHLLAALRELPSGRVRKHWKTREQRA